MGYLGNTPQTQGFTPAVDVFSGNGSTTAFTLSRPVASVSQVEAVIENVPQSPVDAFTVSGNTITFTSAPPSGSSNIYVRYTSPITQVMQPTDGSVTQRSLASGVGNQIGEVSFFAMSSAPAGWVKANGAALSRSTYAALFSAIGTTFGAGDGSTTFNVPDMRGYFPRGWVDNGTVDSGRSFGTTQTDAFASHTHTPTARTATVSFSDGGAYGMLDSGGGGSKATMSTTWNVTSTGGAETRPVNVALLACIKF